jgi:16S rRNA (guanine527-N7)-methyltransferase
MPTDDPALFPVLDPERPLKRPPVVFSDALLEELRRDLARGLTELGLVATDAQIDTLLASLRFLAAWNAVINLTAIREPHDMLVQHLLDSLSVLPHLPAPVTGKTTTLLDVGSGGGFPALPIAVLRPDITVVSIDSVRKKTDYIAKAATYLGLPNLRSVHSRVEDHRDIYDIVISRAFASLRDFVKSTGHNVPKKGAGLLLAMKGKSPDEEIAELKRTSWAVARQEALHVPLLDAQRTLIWLKRV